jgi:hypothetical protein
MNKIWTIAAAATLMAMAGCSGKDDSGDTGGGGGDDGGGSVGYSIAGTIQNFWTGETSAEGLCIQMIDPESFVFEGGDLEYLESDTVEDGAWQVDGLTSNSIIGLLALADDCDGGEAYMGLATGVPEEYIGELDYGDVLTDQVAYFATADVVAAINSGIAEAGYTGSGIDVEGALMGWVISSSDLATAAPVDGATVSGGTDVTCYYADGDDSDGLFMTGGSANTATSSAANAFYVCPAAPVSNYTASDTEGSAYYSIPGGSISGLAQFLRIPRM